jgi:alpha-tubulin suppressor-like RCC1 family protein
MKLSLGLVAVGAMTAVACTPFAAAEEADDMPVVATGSVAPDPTGPADVPASSVRSVAAGGLHSCAVTSAGAAMCWGFNGSGQLGDGTTEQRSRPAPVVGLTAGVLAVTAGAAHTCALLEGGAVKCWGDNAFGRLGDGTIRPSPVPVDVVGLGSGVRAISASGGSTCALTAAEGVKCWGFNGHGTLGTGDQRPRPVPTDVHDLRSGVAEISTGADHTCARMERGPMKCWGNNDEGQLGNESGETGLIGPLAGSLRPSDVKGLDGPLLTMSSGGSHSCAVTARGSLRCWGSDQFGALPGTSGSTRDPVEVLADRAPWTTVSAGFTHTCAIDGAGALTCWGRMLVGTFSAELEEPYRPALPDAAVAVSVGDDHACAVTRAGGVSCWGANVQGQLGDGTTSDRKDPVAVVGP